MQNLDEIQNTLGSDAGQCQFYGCSSKHLHFTWTAVAFANYPSSKFDILTSSDGLDFSTQLKPPTSDLHSLTCLFISTIK